MAILRSEERDRMFMESVSFAKEEAKRRLQAHVQIKADEIHAQFQNNSHLYLVDPRLGFNHRTFRFWINRIPAGEEEGMGWKTLGHRHTVEAVIHVLQGNGHSIIDGVRYDWEPGDFISVPMFFLAASLEHGQRGLRLPRGDYGATILVFGSGRLRG